MTTPHPSDLIQLSAQVGELLKTHHMQLSTAESCTGGGVAEMITAISGSSEWFERGFVTYSNASKQDLLAVQAHTLADAGAVSEETAREMAQGALSHSRTHISVAITGIAGPDGGSLDKPVGTVWLAWAVKGGDCVTQRHLFTGNREEIRHQAVYAALSGLITILTQNTASPLYIAPPVITLDGPGGTGKGTLSQLIAKQLGWHYLDSGASFRVLAYAASLQHIALSDETTLQTLAKTLDFRFLEDENREIQVLLNGADVTAAVRSEACGNAASTIATLPLVRSALLERQRAFQKWPGLVTDGRDMGTVIFPNAKLKFFLHATAEERALRRQRQLKKKGIHVKVETILEDLAKRDARDKERDAAPLKPAPDAIVIDTTLLNIEQSFMKIMAYVG